MKEIALPRGLFPAPRGVERARPKEREKERRETRGRGRRFAFRPTARRGVELHVLFWAGAYPPPAFCDISKSHELRQFRVKGLGYMSLGFRLPNFPLSQIVLAHLGWGLLGNWEIGTYVPVIFPNFPISQIVPNQMG